MNFEVNWECVYNSTEASIYFSRVVYRREAVLVLVCSCSRGCPRCWTLCYNLAEQDKALGHMNTLKRKRDSIFSIIIVLSSTACQWYTWKTMCTCRNISFLNISIHYLHINNLKSWTKNVLHYAHKIGENHYKIGRRRRHANNIENKYSVLHPFPFPSTECASCKTL